MPVYNQNEDNSRDKRSPYEKLRELIESEQGLQHRRAREEQETTPWESVVSMLKALWIISWIEIALATLFIAVVGSHLVFKTALPPDAQPVPTVALNLLAMIRSILVIRWTCEIRCYRSRRVALWTALSSLVPISMCCLSNVPIGLLLLFWVAVNPDNLFRPGR